MGSAVPIISIVSGAAVAILVPLITAAAQSGERRRQHHRERVSALRDTLVKSCFDLSETSTALTHAAHSVGFVGAVKVPLPDVANAESSYESFRERLLDAYRSGLILMLELGPDHEVVKKYGDTIEALSGLQVTLVEARSAPDTAHEKMKEEVGSFFECQTDFHRVASTLLISREETGERVLPMRTLVRRLRPRRDARG